MSCCTYCSQPATMKILSIPHDVCFVHALEFWTGLLAYAKDRSAPCVKHERVCDCPSCEELSASQLRAFAIAATRPSPRDHEHVPMHLVVAPIVHPASLIVPNQPQSSEFVH